MISPKDTGYIKVRKWLSYGTKIVSIRWFCKGRLRGIDRRLACTSALDTFSFGVQVYARQNHLAGESLLGSLPINNIPYSTEIFGLAVLILKIISVLPSINSQKRLELAHNWILVGVGLDLKYCQFECPQRAMPNHYLECLPKPH